MNLPSSLSLSSFSRIFSVLFITGVSRSSDSRHFDNSTVLISSDTVRVPTIQNNDIILNEHMSMLSKPEPILPILLSWHGVGKLKNIYVPMLEVLFYHEFIRRQLSY